MGARDAIAKLISEGIRAYHGSPHSFEKFDMSKIGTGEGAQAYGHGLYFAGHEPTAKGYRERLAGESTPWSMQLGGNDAYKNRSAFDEPTIQGLNELHARMGIYKDPSDPFIAERLRKELAQTIENYQTGAIGMDKYRLSDAQAAQRVLNDPTFKVTPAVTPGHMYEVNIGADPNTMLDWDKPLNQQPVVMNRMPSSMLEAAQKEAQSRAYAATTKKRSDELWGMAKDPYQAPGEFFSGGTFKGPLAAGRMADAGIPGIKYLDERSRGIPQEIERYRTQLADPAMAPHYDQIQKNLATWEAKPVTSNYVVSDPGINIDILRKYGIAGAAAAPVVGSAMGDTYDQSQYEAAP